MAGKPYRTLAIFTQSTSLGIKLKYQETNQSTRDIASAKLQDFMGVFRI
jgi:hypothetical protein